jgi:hypothetical protein
MPHLNNNFSSISIVVTLNLGLDWFSRKVTADKEQAPSVLRSLISRESAELTVRGLTKNKTSAHFLLFTIELSTPSELNTLYYLSFRRYG